MRLLSSSPASLLFSPRTSLVTLALALALAACAAAGPTDGEPAPGAAEPAEPGAEPGTAGASPSEAAPGGPGAPAATPFVPARRFAAAPASWAIAAGLLDPTSAGYARGSLWDLVDMNGDGKADLVVTGAAPGSVFGGATSPHWRVYENHGKGFDATPKTWSVPSSRFAYLRSSGFGVLDVDGDGRLDLVDLSPEGSPSVWGKDTGAPHVRVHRGQAGGFAASAAIWALPATAPSGQAAVSELPGSRQRYVSIQSWAAIDVDGDGKLELVDPTSKPWRVYPEGPSGGFATTPRTWSVPTMPSDAKQQYGFLSLTGHLWATLDLDGDGVLDLVATAYTVGSARLAFQTPAAKTPIWKVYKGAAAGFTSGQASWMVPGAPEYPEDFDRYGPMTDTFDLDGDGRLDLVTMGRTDPYGVAEGKAPYWRVYFGRAGGFGLTKAGAAPASADPGPGVATDLAYEWPLPIAKVGASGVVSRSGRAWAVLDLDGDRRPDLVVMTPQGLDVYAGTP